MDDHMETARRGNRLGEAVRTVVSRAGPACRGEPTTQTENDSFRGGDGAMMSIWGETVMEGDGP